MSSNEQVSDPLSNEKAPAQTSRPKSTKATGSSGSTKNSRSSSVPFEWTEAREQAAMDVARRKLAGETIAARSGVAISTLTRWKKEPEFIAQVAKCREA